MFVVLFLLGFPILFGLIVFLCKGLILHSQSVSFPVAVHRILDDTVSVEVKHEPSSEWEFVNYYSSQNLNNIDVTLTSNRVEITCSSAVPCKTGTNPNNPSFAGIYLVSVEKSSTSQEKLLNVSDKCILPLPPPPPTDCRYLVGSKERFSGIKESTLLDLSTAPNAYQQRKGNWGFPETKDFIVTLEYLDNNPPIEILAPEFPPPDQANIFVKEISMQILEPDSTRKPAKISIKVW